MKKDRIEVTEAANLVAVCRKLAGYETIYAACLKSNISTGTMHRIETGQQDPSVGCLRETLGKMGYRLSLVATRVKS